MYENHTLSNVCTDIVVLAIEFYSRKSFLNVIYEVYFYWLLVFMSTSIWEYINSNMIVRRVAILFIVQ